MVLPSLPHLPWSQLLLTPLPPLAEATLAALDRCTPVEPPVPAFDPPAPPPLRGDL